MLAEALSDRASFRRFCGFARNEATPERTAFVRFRRELTAHGLDRSLFEVIALDLESKGACVRKGTLIDATIIGSASKGDKDAAWVKHKSHAPAHGYKAHVAVDKDSGIIRDVAITAANEPDVNVAPSIVPDEPGEVYGDKAYDALSVEKAIAAKGGTPRLMRKGHRWLRAATLEAHNPPAAPGPCKDRENLWHVEAQLSFSLHAMDRPRQGKAANPSRRDRLQLQTLLAAANGLSGPAKSTVANPSPKRQSCDLHSPQQ
jgi:IS5 family transposase